MGWHRGGWYTYRWVDQLLFPANQPSAERILPDLEGLTLGARIPDGPPESECFFVVEGLEPNRHLVLHSTTHLPLSLRQREDVALSWTWTFVLGSLPDGRTRFHFRCRARVRPPWLRVVLQLSIVPADFVMGRSMCLGLKARVEAETRRPFAAAAASLDAGSV
jgi:hypothetical protein